MDRKLKWKKKRWIFCISTTNPVGIFLRAKTRDKDNDSEPNCRICHSLKTYIKGITVVTK